MSINEMYFSELLGNPAIDPTGEKLGVLYDIGVKGSDPFPEICFIAVKRGKKIYSVEYSFVKILNRRILAFNRRLKNIPLNELNLECLWLRQHILDKQIVDILGSKVVRVNDIKLAYYEGTVRPVAVDIGLLGLLRRLGVGFVGNKFNLKEELISWEYLEPIQQGTTEILLTVPQSKIADLHPSEIAEILSQLNSKERTKLINSLDDETLAEALGEMEANFTANILENLDDKRASEILEQMASDDVADFLGDLPEFKRQRFFALLNQQDQEEIKKLLEYDEKTAGGLMTKEFITFNEELTAEETINKLREMAPDAEMIYYLYVLNEKGQLKGVLSLRDLIVAKPSEKLRKIMRKKIISVADRASAKEVISVIAKYNLLALPVVDKDNRPIGIITVDDVMDLLLPGGYHHEKV